MQKVVVRKKESELSQQRVKHGGLLKIVQAVNAIMFLIKFSFGFRAQFLSLMAVFGFIVLGQVIHLALNGIVQEANTAGVIGIRALVASTVAVLFLKSADEILKKRRD